MKAHDHEGHRWGEARPCDVSSRVHFLYLSLCRSTRDLYVNDTWTCFRCHDILLLTEGGSCSIDLIFISLDGVFFSCLFETQGLVICCCFLLGATPLYGAHSLLSIPT